MDVFSLRDDVIGAYKRFATSFTTIRARDIRTQVEKIYATDRYWPEPLLQINPNYQRTTDVAALVKDGSLEPQMAEIFREPASGDKPKGLPLHDVQRDALDRMDHCRRCFGSGQSLGDTLHQRGAGGEAADHALQ